MENTKLRTFICGVLTEKRACGLLPFAVDTASVDFLAGKRQAAKTADDGHVKT